MASSPRGRCFQAVQPLQSLDQRQGAEAPTSMEEVPLTSEDQHKITRELMVQSITDVLWRAQKSTMTVTATNTSGVVKLMKKILNRRKEALQEKIREQSQMRQIMVGLEELLMMRYPVEQLNLLEKEVWDQQDVKKAKGVFQQVLKFRGLRTALGEVLMREIQEEALQKADLASLKELIAAEQEKGGHQEVKLRITPVQLPAAVRIRSLDLRPGERQVRITASHIYVETVSASQPMQMALLKRSRKVAQTPCGPGYPAEHRSLTLREEDLEPEIEENSAPQAAQDQ